jgi:hypothetical protein
MRAIERRRQENNARKHVRQGSVQAVSEVNFRIIVIKGEPLY